MTTPDTGATTGADGVRELRLCVTAAGLQLTLFTELTDRPPYTE